ncbi:MAG TPA: GNAT family N-acetyltransferase [Actinomycetota bacterium]|nr:GNAT family N-acetyltransferase [Actinomycetota bacterium]
MIDVRLAAPDEVAAGRVVEDRVFVESGYGTLERYDEYLPQSRFHVAYDGDRCVGVLRLIAGGPILPPFLREFRVVRGKARWPALASAGRLEEIATLAVLLEARRQGIASMLYRAVWRDATRRGVTNLGLITEPWRAVGIEWHYRFGLRPIGIPRWYLGSLCGPYMIDIPRAESRVRSRRKAIAEWFESEPP